MNQSKDFIVSKDIQAESVSEGVTREILGYNENLMMVKVSFEKGSIGEIHSHPHVQSSYIVAGKFEITIDGKKQVLSAGEGFFVSSAKAHGVVCIEEGSIIDTFTPSRKDYLFS